jgi:hypothetical protein
MQYKSLIFADSPVTLGASGSDSDNLNWNQNSLVIDFNTTGGVIVLNLPTISSLLFATNQNSGAGAMSFYIKGFNNGINEVSIVPAQGDDVCGVSSASVGGRGYTACFHLFISGINRWGLLSCTHSGPV